MAEAWAVFIPGSVEGVTTFFYLGVSRLYAAGPVGWLRSSAEEAGDEGECDRRPWRPGPDD